MAALPQEKVTLLAALGLAVASAAVCGAILWRQNSSTQAAVVAVDFPDTPYPPAVTEAEVVKTDTWTPPAPQSRGRDWVYDAFTPPEIFYNARTKHFTVKPPAAPVEEGGVVEEAFGVELVSVRPEPFRLQLIGYVGGPGTYKGLFENIATGEAFLATAGRKVPKLNLTIQRFEVRPVEVKIPGSMTTRQLVASAVIVDDKTHAEVTITHRERRFTGELSAFVAQTGEAATREVRKGESFILGDVSYKVEKIELSPPSIDLAKDSPTLTQPDRRTLSPRETDDAPAPGDAPPTT